MPGTPAGGVTDGERGRTMARADDGQAYGQARLETLQQGLPMPLLDTMPDGPVRLPVAKVIVVGGGFAGLSAAWFLRAAGFAPTVLEASDHVGGRVRTSYDFLPGRAIEFGAELVGWNHVLWLGFAKLFGLGFSMLTDDGDFGQAGLSAPLQVNGEVLSDWDATRVYEELDRAVEQLIEPARLVKPYRPWDSIDAKRLDMMSLAEWIDAQGLTSAGNRAVKTLFANDNVVDPAQQSLLGMLSQVAGGGGRRFDADTEVMRCSTGNQSLAFRLRDNLVTAGVPVLTGHPVTAIRVNERGVSVTAAGATHRADYVVLAAPPASWHRMRLPFDTADYDLSWGPAVKFFSRLRRRVWLESGHAPTAVSDVVGETWEGTDNQIGAPDDDVVLSLFAGGWSAEAAMAQRVDPKTGLPDPRSWYRPRLDALFPGYAEARRAAGGTHFQAWPLVPYVDCGYTSPAPGELTTKGKALSEPVGGRLVFAGEHACPAFIGYMEGALESGLLALDQLGALERLWDPHTIRAALEAAADAGWQS